MSKDIAGEAQSCERSPLLEHDVGGAFSVQLPRTSGKSLQGVEGELQGI